MEVISKKLCLVELQKVFREAMFNGDNPLAEIDYRCTQLKYLGFELDSHKHLTLTEIKLESELPPEFLARKNFWKWLAWFYARVSLCPVCNKRLQKAESDYNYYGAD
jgi:hypothetical protein